jgi:uncharacterized protein (DUF1778 family)
MAQHKQQVAAEIDRPNASWPVIGGRCRPTVKRLIDTAAALLGQKRSHFVVAAAEEKAVAVLEEHSISLPETD